MGAACCPTMGDSPPPPSITSPPTPAARQPYADLHLRLEGEHAFVDGSVGMATGGGTSWPFVAMSAGWVF